MKVRSARSVLIAAVGLLAVSCGGPAGTPVVQSTGTVPESFRRDEVIDVLAPDSIRSIDEPSFEPRSAVTWLNPASPVVVLELAGDARAYPLAILTRHEIVNDSFGGKFVAVTYCPLCNSAVAYDRTVGGRRLTFGVSGKLYRSDLVMFDRQTRSLWPQLLGVAVEGALKGQRLEPIPSSIVAYEDFEKTHPDGEVLRRPDGMAYESNPYPGYDRQSGPYEHFFSAETDERLPSMERVVGVAIGEEARAYPYRELQARGNPAIVVDKVGDREIVIFWGGGARSALDTETIDEGRRVGGSAVFDPRTKQGSLTFEVRDGRITDTQTGSVWSLLGRATSGRMRGTALTPVHHLDAFWFAWAAFVPHTEVWSAR